jgi:hypothetical protein
LSDAWELLAQRDFVIIGGPFPRPE